MSRKDTLRFYFRLDDNRLARFMWFGFSSSSEIEFAMNCYGLTSEIPCLSYEYPTLFVSDEEAKSITFTYQDAIKRGFEVDHFTVHQSGRFHMKKAKEPDAPYIHQLQGVKPLDQETGVFLDMRIFSDVVGKYTCFVPYPLPKSLGIPARENEIVLISAFFSGREFNLADWVVKSFGNMMANQQLLCNVTGKHAQAIFWETGRVKATEENRKDYPGGTILAFFFNNIEGGKIVKAFHFA